MPSSSKPTARSRATRSYCPWSRLTHAELNHQYEGEYGHKTRTRLGDFVLPFKERGELEDQDTINDNLRKARGRRGMVRENLKRLGEDSAAGAESASLGFYNEKIKLSRELREAAKPTLDNSLKDDTLQVDDSDKLCVATFVSILQSLAGTEKPVCVSKALDFGNLAKYYRTDGNAAKQNSILADPFVTESCYGRVSLAQSQSSDGPQDPTDDGTCRCMAEEGGEPLPTKYKIFERLSTVKTDALAPFAKAQSKMNDKADSTLTALQSLRTERRTAKVESRSPGATRATSRSRTGKAEGDD